MLANEEVCMKSDEFPFYDAAGIGRYVDEVAVLRKMQENPSFRDCDFTEKERSFVSSCRFYWHTHTQGEVARLARERGICDPQGLWAGF